MSVTTIPSASFCQLHTRDASAISIDVRTGAEFAGSRCHSSVNLPLQDLAADEVKAHIKECGGNDDSVVYLLCQAGKRAAMAAEKLSGVIPNPICVVAGGVQELPPSMLEVGESKVISLERQVRIAAGSLVLVGVLIGVFATSAGFALSAFVGAGLVFAGVSDTCAMGMLLARMPWNRAA